jgi:6-pyruvoyl-tetrahydropterin synthase
MALVKKEKKAGVKERFEKLELDKNIKIEEKKIIREEYTIMPVGDLNSKLDYHNDCLIDIDHLDFEWIRQAQLVSDYSELAVYLEDLKRNLDKKITVKKAQLDQEIRTTSEKITEASIKARIEVVSESFEEAKILEKTNYQLAMAKAALNALDHKKKSLEWLSNLYSVGYFSTPSEKRMTGKSARISEIINDRITNSQREGINRKYGDT